MYRDFGGVGNEKGKEVLEKRTRRWMAGLRWS